jgi:hypothetical protein
MDFEVMHMKRSWTEAADDDVQDHKIVITNYENDDELRSAIGVYKHTVKLETGGYIH